MCASEKTKAACSGFRLVHLSATDRKKIQSNGGIFVAEHNEANVRQREDEKDSSLVYGSFPAGTLRKVCGRYVTVSPAGELRDPGFRE